MRRRLVFVLIAALAAAPMAAHAGEGGKKAKDPYLQLTTLSASILRPSGRHGVLTVEIGVDAPDPALRDQVELSQPILRDAYVGVLQTYALSINPGSPPNADYISMALQRETDRVLGRRGAKLLLGSILIN